MPTATAAKSASLPGTHIPLTQRTIELIKHLEGFVAQPAPDPVGLPTVGYGHQCIAPNCAELPHLPLTPESAHSLLLNDIASHALALALSISPSVTMNPNQWGALVSWAYNVGSESVKHSALVKRLNAGEPPNMAVSQELPKWNSVDGKRLPCLVIRRKKELALFFS
ncbi:hypothetical protein J3B02_004227 [Coemansia erecta]|nr:hypothetical protein J3B02_004227 [Coemansia erecta]KAJ2878304.1 hypothetical protein FB639_003430 [Coemansia asiatica]